MESRAQTAREKFGKMSCAAAVLTTFLDEAGMNEFEAKQAAMPMAGGRMGKCGAILAAEEVLKVQAPDKIGQLEKLFEEKHGSMLRSCPGCVEDACVILEKLLG